MLPCSQNQQSKSRVTLAQSEPANTLGSDPITTDLVIPHPEHVQ